MIPDVQSLMLPVLKFFADGQEKHLRNAEQIIAEEFNLTQEEINEHYPPPSTTRDTILLDRMYWARTYLGKSALLEPTGKRGYWKITDTGTEVLQKNLPAINVKFLKEFSPEFRDWQKSSSQRTQEKNINLEEVSHESISPAEQFEASYNTLRSSLIDDLLDQLKIISPYMFEQIVIDLLVKMGYGGSRSDMAQVTKRSSDGGIDGVIKEDRLGLDMIYVQAKRWQGSVGRPEIQQFCGAMSHKGVTKGVFVTTSNFTKEAREFAEGLSNQKIRLIDGSYLADLMVEHNLGVSIKATYEIKEIDNDYFGS